MYTNLIAISGKVTARNVCSYNKMDFSNMFIVLFYVSKFLKSMFTCKVSEISISVYRRAKSYGINNNFLLPFYQNDILKSP